MRKCSHLMDITRHNSTDYKTTASLKLDITEAFKVSTCVPLVWLLC